MLDLQRTKTVMTRRVGKQSTGICHARPHEAYNNPRRIYFTDGSQTRYKYSATGEKLLVEHYVGSLTLRNGRIDKYQFEEGYCQAAAYSGNASQDDIYFHYYDRDHLGNIRQVIKATGSNKGTVVQRMDYYPFGAQFCDGSADSEVQSRKYNGKELDKMHGLNTYDYGARQYNPVTARWDRVDPLCEKYYSVSPYAYCGGNPVMHIDPDGKIIVLANNCSPEFVKQYNAAYAYLKEHNAAQVWDKLNERKEIITIYEHNENANYTLKDDIYWNPFSGLYTSAKGEGHRISPTIRLIHEMGHKLQELTGEYDTASDGSEWYSKEEKRDILEVETPAAIACGEIPENAISRDSHSGIPFITDSSTSTMIVNPDDPDVKRMIECWE